MDQGIDGEVTPPERPVGTGPVRDGRYDARDEPYERQKEQRMAGNVERFMGGSPLAVVGRLILLSVLVGVVLHALGLDPLNIFLSLRDLAQHLWNMGFDLFRWLWRYFLLGAAIVLPLWLIARLMKAPGRRA